MSGWICKRCETGNDTGLMACEVCDSPLLYTHEELEQVVTQRVNEVKEEAVVAAKAAVKPATTPKPASTTKAVSSPPASSDSSDEAWFVVFILVIILGVVLYVAIFMPALWSEIRTGILLLYNELS